MTPTTREIHSVVEKDVQPAAVCTSFCLRSTDNRETAPLQARPRHTTVTTEELFFVLQQTNNCGTSFRQSFDILLVVKSGKSKMLSLTSSKKAFLHVWFGTSNTRDILAKPFWMPSRLQSSAEIFSPDCGQFPEITMTLRSQFAFSHENTQHNNGDLW